MYVVLYKHAEMIDLLPELWPRLRAAAAPHSKLPLHLGVVTASRLKTGQSLVGITTAAHQGASSSQVGSQYQPRLHPHAACRGRPAPRPP